jgi:pseudouridine kinase
MWLAVMDENGDLAGSISRQPDFSEMERIIDEQGDEIVRECDNIVLEVDTTSEIAQKVFDLAEKHGKDVYVIVGNMGVILKHQEHLPKARLTPMTATYLGWLDLTDYGYDEDELMRRTIAAGVQFTGGRFFGDSGNGFLRINIGCPRAYITEGVKRLKKALEE